MSPYRSPSGPFWSIGRPSSASSLAKGRTNAELGGRPTYDGGDAPRPLSEPGISNERLKNWPRRPPRQVRCRDAKPIPFPSPSHSCRSACLTAIPREPRPIEIWPSNASGHAPPSKSKDIGRTCVPARGRTEAPPLPSQPSPAARPCQIEIRNRLPCCDGGLDRMPRSHQHSIEVISQQ